MDQAQQALLTALVRRYGTNDELRVNYRDVGDLYMDRVSDRLKVRLDDDEAVLYLEAS